MNNERRLMAIKQRLMLLLTAKLIFIGIWLTGWNDVHWFLYVTPVMFATFGITGICPATLKQKFMHASH